MSTIRQRHKIKSNRRYNLREIEVTIDELGRIIVPVDCVDNKEILQSMYMYTAKDFDQIDTAYGINESEIIFGESSMCG